MKKALILFLTICSISFILSSTIKTKADVMPIVYITDNSNCNSFKSQIISNTNYTTTDITMYDWSSSFYSYFSTNYSTLYNVEESYVIFEISHGFDEYIVNNNTYFTDELYDLFEEMKNNDCLILFISGTDESKYYSQNDFLDFVDFHIITDTKHVFIMNMFYELEQHNGLPPIGVDVTFSYDLLYFFGGYYDDNNAIPPKMGFRNKYLLPYVNSRFEDLILNNYTQAEALNESDSYFYVELGNNNMYDSISGHTNESIDLSTFIPNYSWHCVGASNGVYNESSLWINMIIQSSPEYLYYYDANAYNILNSYNSIPYINMYTSTPNFSSPSILMMTIDFLGCGQNYYGIYDNYDGRCDVTHIMYTSGNCGWMISFANDSFDWFNCWDMYINYESGNGLGCAYYDDGSLL